MRTCARARLVSFFLLSLYLSQASILVLSFFLVVPLCFSLSIALALACLHALSVFIPLSRPRSRSRTRSRTRTRTRSLFQISLFRAPILPLFDAFSNDEV